MSVVSCLSKMCWSMSLVLYLIRKFKFQSLQRAASKLFFLNEKKKQNKSKKQKTIIIITKKMNNSLKATPIAKFIGVKKRRRKNKTEQEKDNGQEFACLEVVLLLAAIFLCFKNGLSVRKCLVSRKHFTSHGKTFRITRKNISHHTEIRPSLLTYHFKDTTIS